MNCIQMGVLHVWLVEFEVEHLATAVTGHLSVEVA